MTARSAMSNRLWLIVLMVLYAADAQVSGGAMGGTVTDSTGSIIGGILKALRADLLIHHWCREIALEPLDDAT